MLDNYDHGQQLVMRDLWRSCRGMSTNFAPLLQYAYRRQPIYSEDVLRQRMPISAGYGANVATIQQPNNPIAMPAASVPPPEPNKMSQAPPPAPMGPMLPPVPPMLPPIPPLLPPLSSTHIWPMPYPALSSYIPPPNPAMQNPLGQPQQATSFPSPVLVPYPILLDVPTQPVTTERRRKRPRKIPREEELEEQEAPITSSRMALRPTERTIGSLWSGEPDVRYLHNMLSSMLT